MTPILYSSTETAFTSNGIGRLADARRCEVTEERNGQYELLLEYPTNGALLSYLVAGNYILATHDSTGKPQPFQIYNVSEPLNGFVEVRAWHISYALNAIILKPFTAGSCAETVSLLASKSINTNPFSFWTDKSVSAAFALTVPKSVRAVLGGSEGSLLDVYGKGEYEFDLYDVKLHLNRGVDRGVQIRYGKNLVSLERELDASNIHNAVVPYWTDGETTVSLDHLVVKTGQTAGRAVALDLSDSWDAAPSAAELETKAQTIIDASESYELKENLKLDFVFLWQTEEYKDIANLERVNLCDTVHIVYTKRGINATAKVIRVVYDALRERYLEMELGEPRTSLYQQIQRDTVQTVTPMIPSRPAIQSAIDKATELIGGGFGGYIKYKYLVDGTPSEMLIMDTPSEATATNIIRLNQNGIGFSTDGGATYRNAWTIDGQLNADFITTGNLIANIITTGLLQDATGDNYWNLDTGEFNTQQGHIGDFVIADGKLSSGTVGIDSTGAELTNQGLIYSYKSPYLSDTVRMRYDISRLAMDAARGQGWKSALIILPNISADGLQTSANFIAGASQQSIFMLHDPDFATYPFEVYKNAEFLGDVKIANPLPISSGGTGQASAPAALEALSDGHIFLNRTLTSGSPITLTIGGAVSNAYWGALVTGFIQNIGAIVLAVRNDAGTITARNLVTNSSWNSSALSFTVSGNTLTISTNQSSTNVVNLFIG